MLGSFFRLDSLRRSELPQLVVASAQAIRQDLEDFSSGLSRASVRPERCELEVSNVIAGLSVPYRLRKLLTV